MKSLGLGRYALSIGAAAAMLAGCGGSQPPTSAAGAMPQSRAIAARAQHGGSWMLPEAKSEDLHALYKMSRPLLFVTNYNADANNVTIYHADAKSPSPLAIITDGIGSPEGDCIDAAGTLYVANEDGSGWVSEYASGHTKRSKLITDGINIPAFCAIDSSGNLWVANLGGANATEYEKGSTKPHTVITNGLTAPVGIAIDHSGNLYVSNRLSTYSGNVQVYSPGSQSPTRTITDGVTSPAGLSVDANGTLFVTNVQENTIEEYLAGTSDPYQAITEGLNVPSDVTITEKGHLFVNNYSNNVVVEYPPGSIKPSGREISKDLNKPAGSAYFPPLLP